MAHEQTNLPSKFQLDGIVNVTIAHGIYRNCRVVKVAFAGSKVLYDVEYKFSEERYVVSEGPGPDIPGLTTEIVSDVISKSVRLYNVEESYLSEAPVA